MAVTLPIIFIEPSLNMMGSYPGASGIKIVRPSTANNGQCTCGLKTPPQLRHCSTGILSGRAGSGSPWGLPWIHRGRRWRLGDLRLSVLPDRCGPLTLKRKTRHGVDDEHTEGKLFAGFTIGRGQPTLARIYHKGMEIRKSGKMWLYNIWELHGWHGGFDVWMVEFQLRRAVLKEFGVSTIEDLLENVDAIWAYCTKRWLTLCRPNGSNAFHDGDFRESGAPYRHPCFVNLRPPW